jgi:hypothetical protein
MKLSSLFLVVVLGLTGCVGSMVPKRVEFFQDKVKAFPEQSEKLRELERQAIYQSHEKATETVVAALKENATTNVVAPARDTMKLTQAAMVAAGPPEKLPDPNNVTNLVTAVEQGVGKYNLKVEKFAKNSDENVGKKIEGTGLIQVPYLLWVGGVVLFFIILYTVLKIVLAGASLANPGAAVGYAGLNIAEGLAKKGFHQVVTGCEEFKDWVKKEFSGDQSLQSKLLETFRVLQMGAQDKDVQTTIKSIT